MYLKYVTLMCTRLDLDDRIGGSYSLYSIMLLKGKGRPRNSFFLVVANFCYHVQDQVAKLILW